MGPDSTRTGLKRKLSLNIQDQGGLDPMPMYSLQVQSEGRALVSQKLGFYQDRAAVEYARKMARGSAFQVWRDSELIASTDSEQAAQPELA
jgi:hypothetical protein